MIRIPTSHYPAHRSEYVNRGSNTTRIGSIMQRHCSLSSSIQEASLKSRFTDSTEKKIKAQAVPQILPKDKEVAFELDFDKLIEKGKSQLKYGDEDQIGLIGPPPGSIEGMLAWRVIEIEKIQRNLQPMRRKKIEEAAQGGDPFSQLELKKIQEYESWLLKNKQLTNASRLKNGND